MGKAMLDPKRDLAGATPETLGRALARPLLARRRAKEAKRETRSSSRKAKGRAENLGIMILS